MLRVGSLGFGTGRGGGPSHAECAVIRDRECRRRSGKRSSPVLLLVPILLSTTLTLTLVWARIAEARLLAFRSPSGNITCVMSTTDGTFAQCELRSMPVKGGFMLPPRGRVRRYDVGGDDLAGRRFVLQYGQSRRLRRYRCTSRERGMTCRNIRSHHGFFLSRGHQRSW